MKSKELLVRSNKLLEQLWEKYDKYLSAKKTKNIISIKKAHYEYLMAKEKNDYNHGKLFDTMKEETNEFIESEIINYDKDLLNKNPNYACSIIQINSVLSSDIYSPAERLKGLLLAKCLEITCSDLFNIITMRNFLTSNDSKWIPCTEVVMRILANGNDSLLEEYRKKNEIARLKQVLLKKGKNAKKLILIISSALFFGCENNNKLSSANNLDEESSCRGIYYTTDSSGKLHKWNEYYNKFEKKCFIENKALSNWHQSLQERKDAKKICKPQQGFGNKTVIASNNYYQYRDGRMFIDFNSSTGEYRKIYLAEKVAFTPHGTINNDYHQNGFSRELGCFVTKQDSLTGNWIYLDNNEMASSSVFSPSEIYQYTETEQSLFLDRKDDWKEWSGRHCPISGTPWEYCTELRNGNIMYGPDLDPILAAALYDEAVLMRTKFNFDFIQKANFDSLWDTLEVDTLYTNNSNLDLDRMDWKYSIDFIYSAPAFTWQAYVDYIYGYRPNLPDETITSPLLCFEGSKTITLSDGSTGKIRGEICYENGKYNFTAF